MRRQTDYAPMMLRRGNVSMRGCDCRDCCGGVAEFGSPARARHATRQREKRNWRRETTQGLRP